MTRNRIILISGGGLFLFLVMAFLLYLPRQTEQEIVKESLPSIKKEVILPKTAVYPEPPARRRLTPSRPEDYGCTTYSEDEEPQTQEEWNVFMAKEYREAREKFEEEYAEEVGVNLYKKFDEATIEEIEKAMGHLDSKIASSLEQLKETSGDERLEKELKHLRQYKALINAIYGEELEKKGP